MDRAIYLCILVSASLFLSSKPLPLQYEDLEDLPGIIPTSSPHKLVKVEDSPGLSISIDAGKDAASSKVSITGYLQHIISDTERMTFHLSDYELKQAVGKYFGKILTMHSSAVLLRGMTYTRLTVGIKFRPSWYL